MTFAVVAGLLLQSDKIAWPLTCCFQPVSAYGELVRCMWGCHWGFQHPTP